MNLSKGLALRQNDSDAGSNYKSLSENTRETVNHSAHEPVSLIRQRGKNSPSAAVFSLKKIRPPQSDGLSSSQPPSLQLELQFQLQLDASWIEQIAATSSCGKAIPVYDTKITSQPVRLAD